MDKDKQKGTGRDMRPLHLGALRKRQKKLLSTFKTRKSNLEQAYDILATKDQEIQELNKKLEKLQNGEAEVEEGKAERESGSGNKAPPDVAALSLVETERMDAILILPEEIWRMILENLSDPADLWRCCLTCGLFEDILETWRTRYLIDQALPSLYSHLPRNKLLKSRLVCKSWKDGVDSFVEDHPSLRPNNDKCDPRMLEFISPIKDKDLAKQNVFTISGHDDGDSLNLRDLYSQFSKVKGQNPFIGGYASLVLGVYNDNDDDNTEAQLWDKVYLFLKTFGKHIRYLTINFPFECDLTQEKLVQFSTVDLYQLLPNLRKLRIGDPPPIAEVTLEENPVHAEYFAAAPNLETFENDSFNDNPIYIPLLERHQFQLRKLRLTVEFWTAGVNLIDFPSLTELHLLHVGRNEDLIEGLFDVGIRMPELNTLGLHIIPRNYSTLEFEISFEDLSGIIRNLSSNTKLSTLILEGGVQRMPFGNGNPQVETGLPETLKTLRINHYCGGLSPPYAFLLRFFPFVENVHLFLRKNPAMAVSIASSFQSEVDLCLQEEYTNMFIGAVEVGGNGSLFLRHTQEEILEVNKYIFCVERLPHLKGLNCLCRKCAAYRRSSRDGGNMYKSNIWKLMSRLKVFTFQRNVYTREEYERYADKFGTSKN